MANANKDAKGWRIKWVCPTTGSHKTIRVGVAEKRQAELVAQRVSEIVHAGKANVGLPDATVNWISKLSPDFRVKLENAGLIEQTVERVESGRTLGKLVETFIAKGTTRGGRPAAKSTLLKWGTVKLHLLTYFESSQSINSITAEHAHEFAQWLQQQKPNGAGLALNSARKVIANAKLFFQHAESLRWIEKNSSPFGDVVSSTVANRTKDYFITRDDYEALLAACPTTEWRVLLAFSRYGGLRIPSEIAELRWSDIQTERHRFTVRATKTAHKQHLQVRETPLFPEIAEELDRLRSESDTTGHVFTMKLTESNLPTRFGKLIERAGLEKWPKPFQNMRASRRTELQAEGYDNHVLNCWFGHSTAVAEQSYLQVGDADYTRATKSSNLAPQLAPSRWSIVELKETLRDMKFKKPNEFAVIAEYIGLLESQ